MATEQPATPTVTEQTSITPAMATEQPATPTVAEQTSITPLMATEQPATPTVTEQTSITPVMATEQTSITRGGRLRGSDYAQSAPHKNPVEVKAIKKSGMRQA